MTIRGYARCSLNEEKQDIERQVRELKKAGASIVYIEYIHGDSKNKLQLNSLLDQSEPGDEIITLEVSRLARSTKQLIDIIDVIKSKHLCLRVIGSITIDFRAGELDPMSQAFILMAGIFAELELAMIRERVRSGVAYARSKGKQIGRPKLTKDDIPDLFYKHYPSYIAGAINKSEFARISNVSRTSLYKYLDLLEDNNLTTNRR